MIPRTARRFDSVAAVALVGLLFALPGCALQGLNFLQDDRLTITSPGDRDAVRLPATVTWKVSEFKITGKDGKRDKNAGYFGVFVDRAPQPPQRTAEWMFREDAGCRVNPTCPSPEFFAAQNIFFTSETSFTIERLPPPPSNVVQRREFHEATIVLLNGRGERIGESAFTVEFEVKRGR